MNEISMFSNIRKIKIIFLFLLLLLCSCIGGDFTSFFSGYSRIIPVSRLENQINISTHTNYGHIILMYNLLDLNIKRYSYPSATRSQISSLYLYLTTADMEEEKFSQLTNILAQKVIVKTKNHQHMLHLLSVRSVQKIKDLKILLNILHNQLKINKIQQSNQIRTDVDKMIFYLSKTDIKLDSMSLHQNLAILQKISEVIEKIPLNSPIYKYRVTDRFRMRAGSLLKGKRMHTGIDIVGSKLCDVFATASGVVVYSGRMGSYGNLVIIEHGRGVSTYYAHLKKISVRPGRSVLIGERVGMQGSTGNSTGDHLHYEIRFNNCPINPEILYKF